MPIFLPVWARRTLAIFAVAVVSLAAILAAIVTFGVAPAPAPLQSVAEGMQRMDLPGLPALSGYRARDGALLAYRAYPGVSRQIVVLIHGSAGQSPLMNAMARTLNQTGATVYTLDIRGHGSSGPRGDIKYIGQLEDDLADFMGQIKTAQPDAVYTLAGFSAGGAFALRVAGEPDGKLFDRYIAISPALTFPNGVARPNGGGWAAVSLPRIVGLVILNHLGIHRFDGLNVVSFGAPPGDAFFTRSYTYRLAMNFSPGLGYLSALALVKKPIAVIAGADDEQFYADRYAALLKPVKPDVTVELVPGVGHTTAMGAPAMLEAVRRTFETMPQR